MQYTLRNIINVKFKWSIVLDNLNKRAIRPWVLT